MFTGGVVLGNSNLKDGTRPIGRAVSAVGSRSSLARYSPPPRSDVEKAMLTAKRGRHFDVETRSGCRQGPISGRALVRKLKSPLLRLARLARAKSMLPCGEAPEGLLWTSIRFDEGGSMSCIYTYLGPPLAKLEAEPAPSARKAAAESATTAPRARKKP